MKTVLMNMVRIFRNNEVVVLDKKIKYGWEGTTFPGGKVEPGETFYDSAVREAKEETNLDVYDLEFNGIIQWIEDGDRFVGYLYTCRKFDGELIEESEEGRLFFEDYEKFKTMDGHSQSMEYIFPLYEGEYKEVCLFYEKGELIRAETR